MDLSALSQLLGGMDVMYILMCNVVTYVIISVVSQLVPKTFEFKKIYKRLISAVGAIALGIVMCQCFDHDAQSLFYGFFIQFITWDYVFKGWLNKLYGIFGSNEDTTYASAMPMNSKAPEVGGEPEELDA